MTQRRRAPTSTIRPRRLPARGPGSAGSCAIGAGVRGDQRLRRARAGGRGAGAATNPLAWHFARSLIAKTDRIDAAMLARIGAERGLALPGLRCGLRRTGRAIGSPHPAQAHGNAGEDAAAQDLLRHRPCRSGPCSRSWPGGCAGSRPRSRPSWRRIAPSPGWSGCSRPFPVSAASPPSRCWRTCRNSGRWTAARSPRSAAWPHGRGGAELYRGRVFYMAAGHRQARWDRCRRRPKTPGASQTPSSRTKHPTNRPQTDTVAGPAGEALGEGRGRYSG